MATLRSGKRLSNDNNNETDEDKKSQTPVKNNTTIVVFFGLLIDLLAFTLILPLFPALISHYRDNDSSGLFSALETKVDWFRESVGAPVEFNTVLFGGFLGSIFSFLQFLASPIIGGLSDRFGRKPLMIATCVGISFSYFLWVMSSNFAIFVLARIIGGVSKGNVSLSTAIVTDVSTPATRGKGMALIGVAFSLGFLFGPMIGAGFSMWGKQSQSADWYFYPALFALTLSIVDVFYFVIFFKESLPASRRNQSTSATFQQALEYVNPVKLFKFSSLANLEKSKHEELQNIGTAYFIYLFLYSGMEFTLTFLTHIRFDFTPMQQGRMFLFVGIVMAVLQGAVVRRIPQGREKKAAMGGLLLIVPSFVIVGTCSTITQLYLGLGLYAVSTAFVVPCLTTLVSQYGETHQKGIVTGVFRSLGALGRAAGPIFGSFLYWSLGPELSYSLGGVGLLIPYLMLKRMN